MVVRELPPWLLACGWWLDYSPRNFDKSLAKAGYLTLSACAVYSMEPPMPIRTYSGLGWRLADQLSAAIPIEFRRLVYCTT